MTLLREAKGKKVWETGTFSSLVEEWEEKLAEETKFEVVEEWEQTWEEKWAKETKFEVVEE